MKRLLLTLVALAATQFAEAAETVYRCGPTGNEYSKTPCADGKAVQLDDGRTPAQQRQAADAARREAALAEKMTRERERQEAKAPKAAAGIGHAPANAASKPAHAKAKMKRKQTSDRDSSPTAPLRGAKS